MNKPRIIYNDDSCSLRLIPPPHNLELVDTALGYLRDTQVDCLCWCVAEETAYSYKSEIIENYFDIAQKLQKKAANSPGGFTQERNLMLSLHKQGIDYLPLLIERAHRQGLSFVASFRMNDTHHKSIPDGLLSPAYWKEHQHYRLWDVTYAKSYYNAALDYSYEEVRRRKLDTVAEVAQNYDVDGIELDFCRNPFFFQPSEAWEKRDILTFFVAEIRGILDRIGAAKGRDLSLIVRVPFDREMLTSAGMDVKRWLQRRLPDILVMSTLSNSYNQSVQPWLDLCRKNGVLFYPSVEAGTAINTAYSKLPLSNPVAPAHNHGVTALPQEKAALQRAMAQNYLAQGTDGVYMFNYPCILFERGSVIFNDKDAAARLTAILYELGDMKTLLGRSKYYMYYEDLPLYVEANRPAEYHQTAEFDIRGDDAADGRVTLRFRQIAEKNPHCYKKGPQNPIVASGVMKYTLNGEEIREEDIRRTEQPAGKIRSGFKLRRHELIEIELPGKRLKEGRNRLGFEIPHFPKAFDPYVYVYELEAEVAFGSPIERTEGLRLV